MPEPYYTSANALRAKLGGISEDVLPDDEAVDLIEEAEDAVDERLGNRPVDADTGRKVIAADVDTWRFDKLAKATLEVAAVIFRDPGVLSRQRVRSVSGDVSTSSPYGPAFGERAETLLTSSGLVCNFARVGRRRSVADRISRDFDQHLP